MPLLGSSRKSALIFAIDIRFAFALTFRSLSKTGKPAPEATGRRLVTATRVHDIFVIGGGINGCGIARDAAGRGYSVFLAEMNDLASGTSSAATKLIHGGLRYLEHYEFRLVREALAEREVLWASGAAHHLAAAVRAAAPQGAAAGLAPAARPVRLRPPRRAQAAAGDARRSTCAATRRASR